jgi:hypothetical protein
MRFDKMASEMIQEIMRSLGEPLEETHDYTICRGRDK